MGRAADRQYERAARQRRPTVAIERVIGTAADQSPAEGGQRRFSGLRENQMLAVQVCTYGNLQLSGGAPLLRQRRFSDGRAPLLRHQPVLPGRRGRSAEIVLRSLSKTLAPRDVSLERREVGQGHRARRGERRRLLELALRTRGNLETRADRFEMRGARRTRNASDSSASPSDRVLRRLPFQGAERWLRA